MKMKMKMKLSMHQMDGCESAKALIHLTGRN